MNQRHLIQMQDHLYILCSFPLPYWFSMIIPSTNIDIIMYLCGKKRSQSLTILCQFWLTFAFMANKDQRSYHCLGNCFPYACFTSCVYWFDLVSFACKLLFLFLLWIFSLLSFCLFFPHYPLSSNSLVYLNQKGIIAMFSLLLY